MPADTASAGSRPPGCRSILLYGPPSADATTAADASVTAPPRRKSATIVDVAGPSPFHSIRSDGPGSYATSAMMLSQASFMSASPQGHAPSMLPMPAAGGAKDCAVRTEDIEGAMVDTSPRQLRGRLNEGTLHRAPPVALSATRHVGTRSIATMRSQSREASKGRGPKFGPSVVSWVRVECREADQVRQRSCSRDGSRNGNLDVSANSPQSRASCCGSIARAEEIAQMVSDASLRNTWAMRFENAAALRQAVSTDTDAYTHFEEALVAELNTLRRAPAEYAAVVEQEAKVGAPYVLMDDRYFISEAAAEEAAVNLRRQVEQEATQEIAAAASAAAAPPFSTNRLTATSSTASMSSKGGPSTHATIASVGSGASTPATGATLVSPTVSDRKKAKRRCNTNAAAGAAAASTGATNAMPSSKEACAGSTTASESRDAGLKRKGAEKPHTAERHLPQPEPDQETVEAATPDSTPSAIVGPQELTLAGLRHQFRCQQRYRAALETALKELRESQRQAELAQLAAWAAEDEKAQKRARRLTANTAAIGGSSSAFVSNTNAGGLKKSSFVPSAPKGNPTIDGPIFRRRSEEAAQIHRVYEQRVQRLELELQRARGACQRSLAGGNLISSAVRALRKAQPAPPLKHNRGLALAARDTAEAYYGDEERVTALSKLYAVSRATLTGLSDFNAPSSPRSCSRSDTTALVTPPSTLEELSQCERVALEGADAGAASPSSILPVLSEEALALAQVAQRMCTTYGYISGEVRGVHLQGIGSPRMLMLQCIVGCLTPVVDITHQPGSSTPQQSKPNGAAAEATDADGTAMQYYAGVRLEGKTYAAYPEALSQKVGGEGAHQASEEVYAAVFGTKSDHRSSLAGTINADSSLTVGSSHATESAEDATQRLWPLLWSSASTIGCGWQQVRGWQHIPTYTEACQLLEAVQQGVAPAKARETVVTGTAAAVPRDLANDTQPCAEQDNHPAVICTTLLLASGFEEYEVGRACSGMAPAATRRIVLELTKDIVGGDSGSCGSEVGGALQIRGRGGDKAGGVRRAAIEVHSTLGVTLLTPTMHPVIVPPPQALHSNCSGTVICVAIRVPYDEGGDAKPCTECAATAVRRLVFEEASLPASIRAVAQVTRQSDPTPPSPSVNPMEVLIQRSPADPSVWLIFVNTATAFALHGATGDGPAAPLALHLFAKDLRDATGGYEHVAFIRLQQGHGLSESPSFVGGAAAYEACHSVLMAPEWRHLLTGLSCMPFSSAVTQTTTATRSVITAAPKTDSVYASPTSTKTAGWAVLHEPLLGRDGVVLYPLSSSLRASCRKDSLSNVGRTELPDVRAFAGNALSTVGAVECGSEVIASVATAVTAATGAEDAVHVAIQLPARANALWWGRRIAVLHAVCDQLEAEVAAEEGQEKRDTVEGETDAHPEKARGSTEEGGTSSVCTTAVAESNPADDASSTPALGEQPLSVDAGTLSNSEEVVAKPDKDAPTSAITSPTPPPPLPSPAVGAATAEAPPTKTKSGNGRSAGKAGSNKRIAAGDRDGCVAPAKRGDKGNAKASTRVNAGGGAAPPSVSGVPPFNCRRPLSFHLTFTAPDSLALREYDLLLKSLSTLPSSTKASASHSTANAIGVPACLQSYCISLSALRSLNEQLRNDSQIWQTHIGHMIPLLESERERLASEVLKKKGKEQQRLQHDQEDVARELADLQRRGELFQQAIDNTWEALRKRERAQVLRRARLSRLMEELAGLEARMSAFKDTTGSALAAPRVTLRLFTKAAVAVGSGRNAAAAVTQIAAQYPSNVLDFATGAEDESRSVVSVSPSPGAVAAATAPDDVVVLQPQPGLLLSTSAASSCGNPPPVVYAASCSVPPSFSGQATLLIDDEVAVTWSV
ncbi:hypothetical protein ABL78_0993 [Leptomonas seymouri]|uniref:Uncharacterized protein n=1 Tax=Leptomonas seymouri TaxID=5684 RepID=A0A0N1I828_LEPSE|nr:hypothetical protein ABL78_0993 [Leptomonas seymouri]|eukprot:KPI89921.1 hypothetical protein ABL78_0993 [Leptomonas seymouri]